MRKALSVFALVVLFTVSVATTMVIAEAHYIKHKNNQPAPEPTITVSESNKKIADEELKYQSLLDRYNLQTAECVKGTTAYDKLSPAIKSQTPAPSCQPRFE